MNIYLYENSSSNNVLNKSLTYNTEISNVTLLEPTNIIKPTFILHNEMWTESNLWTGYNYLYVPQFDRYYYITNITFLKGMNVQLDCKVDVLMSFAKSIYTTQYIDRCENMGLANMYLADDEFNFHGNDQLETIPFGDELIGSNDDFLLTTIG